MKPLCREWMWLEQEDERLLNVFPIYQKKKRNVEILMNERYILQKGSEEEKEAERQN